MDVEAGRPGVAAIAGCYWQKNLDGHCLEYGYKTDACKFLFFQRSQIAHGQRRCSAAAGS